MMRFCERVLPLATTLVFAMVCGLSGGMAMAQAQTVEAPLRVYSAGSLREALTEVARLYEAGTGVKVALTFGASGLLRERIEKGEPAQVFASADTQHPEKLFSAGNQWQKPVLFVRNRLCALTAPGLAVTSANLLESMLNPALKLGTSTPKADPAGDYAWALFGKAELLKPGAYAALDAKALKLTGSSDSPQPPAGRTVYAWLMEEGRADIALTYCTNARSAQRESPRLEVVEIPPALQVGAAYGLVARSSDPAATQFVQFVLSPPAQVVFAKSGFVAP